jgi:GNAT superfamily N-acetyltransferase
MTVIAVRPARHTSPAHTAPPKGLVIRQACSGDLDRVAELEMGVVRYDAYFGGSIPRPATGALVRAETQAALAKRPGWTWLAEQDGQPVAVAVVEPPESATWIANMTRAGATAYLQTMFVRPRERSSGTGAALVRQVHDELDARGIGLTLLHHAQVNPLSAPVLAPDGIPAAVGLLGGPPRRPHTLTRAMVPVRSDQGMIIHGSAGMLSAA